MRILLVAPIPPPVSGNSLPIVALKERLSERHEISVVNLSREDHGSGGASLKRVHDVLNLVADVRKMHRSADVVYLTLAESMLGNLRDLLLLAVLRQRRRSVVLHMFGGASMMTLLAQRRSARAFLTRRLFDGVSAIVCEGSTQATAFEQACPSATVHQVANFASSELFVSDEELERKFAMPALPRRILFLSNMLPGKGHRELIAAFEQLRTEVPFEIQLDVAGALADDGEAFEMTLQQMTGVRYHCEVGPEGRRELFRGAHVFCLPTFYAFEGQPFSIVESYASGCAVVTCLHSGIPDIFADQVNGLAVAQRDVDSLKDALRLLVTDPDRMATFARYNRNMAERLYTRERFEDEVCKVLVNAGRDA